MDQHVEYLTKRIDELRSLKKRLYEVSNELIVADNLNALTSDYIDNVIKQSIEHLQSKYNYSISKAIEYIDNCNQAAINAIEIELNISKM